MTLSSEDVGNLHYGAVAASTFWCSLQMALYMAGWAQIHQSKSKEEWNCFEDVNYLTQSPTTGAYMHIQKVRTAPYGDDPKDQQWIQIGYNLKIR